MSSGVRGAVLTASVLLVNCWVLSNGADPKKDPLPFFYAKVGIVDAVIGMAEQDRLVLKTIVVNQALTVRNLLMSLVMVTRQQSGIRGRDCALAQYYVMKPKISKITEELNKKVDETSDEFIKEWTKRIGHANKTDPFLVDYWTQRDDLYQFITNTQHKPCNHRVKCSGSDLLMEALRRGMKAMAACIR